MASIAMKQVIKSSIMGRFLRGNSLLSNMDRLESTLTPVSLAEEQQMDKTTDGFEIRSNMGEEFANMDVSGGNFSRERAFSDTSMRDSTGGLPAVGLRPEIKTSPYAWPPATPWAEVPKLQSVKRDDQQKMLHVEWENGAQARFAYVWLRDNCPAPHTYQLTDRCKARKMIMAELDVDVQPRLVENRGDHVYVEWPEGNISVYESKWLALRNLDCARVRARRNQVLLNDQMETWGRREIEQRSRWYDFETLLNDDRSLHDALMEIVRNGILLIDKAPAKVGQLKRFASRIGFEYMTHYGNFFTVKSGANPSNVAYTSGGLGMHSDLPYLLYAPQIQALHTIEQVRTKGGENQFADSFRIAEQIRRFDPESYNILCTVPLEYVDDGRDYVQFDLTYRRPVLNFDRCGRLVECHFSNQQRSWFYDVPVEQLYSVYKALKLFDSFMRKPENMLEFKTKPGQIVIFHNLRVLHGRSSFEMTAESGGRHMEGCYFNWDFVKSQIRIIRDRLSIEPNQVSV